MDPFDGLVPDPTHAYQGRPPSGWGRKALFAVLGLLGAATAVVIVLEVCGVEAWPRSQTVWERITYRTFPNKAGTSDVFYNRKVTKDQARQVGDVLEKDGLFLEDHPVTVFVTREGEEYVVAFFINPNVPLDPSAVEEFDALRVKLSREVFGGGPVCINLCDTTILDGLDPKLIPVRQIR